MVFLAALVIVLAGWAAYSNSFHGPFINDDTLSIEENPTIKQGWLMALRTPKGGETSAGRPVVNLSLAINYDLGGLSVEGYHATNLAIHLLAGLTLFGLVRRTLELPTMRAEFGQWALPLALAVALLWTLHPLQTNSVTYTVQRAEELMGLFYLLTVYCFVHGEQAAWANGWRVLAVIACLLSVLSKEVAVTIPVIVLLYDRTFVADSFAVAWRRRWRWHLALASTWIPLAWEVHSQGNRGGSAGFGTGVSWWEYADSQFRTITTYLWLSIWPHPLQHDYGIRLNYELVDVIPYALAMAGLVATTAYLLWKRPKLGFLGAWIFIILAPSSSVVPIPWEPIAEHRMYLPLAGVMMLAVLGLWKYAAQKMLAAVLLMTLAFGLLTFLRNEDYQSKLRIWADAISKSPDNASEHDALGTLLALAGRMQEALGEFRLGLRYHPGFWEGENNLAVTYAQLGKYNEAIFHYTMANRYQPHVVTYCALGKILITLHRYNDAAQQFMAALRLNPNSFDAEFSLGNVYALEGQPQQAVTYYQRSEELKPDDANVYSNEGTVLLQLGRPADARRAFEAALRLNPDLTQARAALETIRPAAIFSTPSP